MLDSLATICRLIDYYNYQGFHRHPHLKMAKTNDRWVYSNMVNCMVLKSSPIIKTELEDKDTGQESESRIMCSNKNQTAVVRNVYIQQKLSQGVQSLI